MSRRRAVSDAERTLWQTAMRETAPLDHRRPAVTGNVEPKAEPRPSPSIPTVRRTTPGDGAATLDRRTADRLKRGQLPIEARIDLHGMTQIAARAALDGFVTRMAAAGRRTLLVITGKGSRLRLDGAGSSEATAGILRREVPRWLGEAPHRPLVLAVREAASRHGGGGALYVLLRRQRER